jgi:hypothetical protein
MNTNTKEEPIMARKKAAPIPEESEQDMNSLQQDETTEQKEPAPMPAPEPAESESPESITADFPVEEESPFDEAGAATEPSAEQQAPAIPPQAEEPQEDASEQTEPDQSAGADQLDEAMEAPPDDAHTLEREIMDIDFSAGVETLAPAPPDDEEPLEEDLPAVDAEPVLSEEDSEPVLAEEGPAEPAKSDRQMFFELDFRELDRRLTPEERQEWNSIYASYRGRSALNGTIIGVDRLSLMVYNAETDEMEREDMYCAIVVPYRVRIVIPATEMWDEGQARPDFVLQNMVGSHISFIVIKVDREGGFAIASRKRASRVRRLYFSRRPALQGVGARIQCNVLSVGPRRCLVECYGHDIGLTQREMRYTAISDMRTEYHPGQTLDCVVKAYDKETDKLEISIKEIESNPFDGAELRHPVGARRLAVIAGKYGGGVFCNLPDGTVCMCNYSYQHEDSDFMAGDQVMLVVQRFEPSKRQMYGKILSKW